jgi:hypothetical protein
MPSMTTGQQGYAPAPPPTVEPVPVYEEQAPPPPAYEGAVPLPSQQQAAPVEQAPPPEQYADAIPLPSRQSAAPVEQDAPAQVPAEEPPKDEPTPIRSLGTQTEKTKADVGRGVGQIMGGDILGGFGTIKDAAGDQMTAQGGDIFPWRRMATNAMIDEYMNGEPSADAPIQDRFKDALLTGTGTGQDIGVIGFIREDEERARQIYEQGYTSQGGTYTEPGPAAVWEAYVDPMEGWKRGVADITADPTSALGLVGGALGAASKAPKAVQVAGRAVDAATSLGLSEAVPIATKGIGTGLKKVGILAPTARQTAEDTAEEAGEVASAAATMRREAGLVGSTNKAIEKKGDITTLRDPSGGLADITYQTGKNAAGLPTVTGIIDDPANPAVVRPVTEADRALILDHSRNLNYDDFGQVRDTWYREMFDATDPSSGKRTSYLETYDPEIGTPIPDRVDAWNRYRDLYAHRMSMIDSVNPDRPILRSLLEDWDASNTRFLDMNGLSASERRLSAIEKITKQAGLWDTVAQDMFIEARKKLRTGPMDFLGMEVLDKRYNLGPLSKLSQQALKAQVVHMPDDFYRQVGTINSPGMQHLLSPKKALIIKGSRDLAMSQRYDNLQELMGQRFAQYGEKEAHAMGEWLAKQVSKGKSDMVNAMLDALNNASRVDPITGAMRPMLDRTVGTAADAVAAINALKAAGTPPWPKVPAGTTPTLTSSLTPKASSPPPGVYRAGSASEAIGAETPKAWDDVLEMEHEFGGVKKKVFQTVIEQQDQLENLRRLAQLQKIRTLTAKEQDMLDRGIKGLHEFAEFKNDRTGKALTGGDLAGWTDAQVDSVAARRAQRFVEQAIGLTDAAGKAVDPSYYRGVAGRALKAYDNFAGFRRTMSLYSTTRGPAYVLMQAIGNGITLGLAKPSALRRYTPVSANDIRKWATGDITAPAPRAVAMRENLGLGATPSLGMGGRDQLGAKTFFARSTNPIVRGLGKIAAPQIVKEFADSFDTALRHAVYATMMEPAMAALKRELPERIERSVLSVATNTATPIGIGRAEIDNALQHSTAGGTPRCFWWTYGTILQRAVYCCGSGGKRLSP